MNKKKILIISALVVALCAIAAGVYYFVAKGSNEKYAELVPKDATVVCTVNLKSLGEKVGTENLSKLSETSNLPASMKKYKDDPKKIGIDPRVPAYIFMIDNKYACSVLSTLSASDFENFVNDMSKEESGISKVKEVDGYKVSEMSSKGSIVFNNDAILIITSISGGDNGFSEAKKLFTLDKTAQFIGTDDYAKLNKDKNDISAILSYATLAKFAKEYNKKIDLPEGFNVDNFKLIGNCNFGNGAVECKGEVYSTDAAEQKKLESYWAEHTKKVNGDYLGLMDENSVLFVTGDINGDDIVKGIDEVLNSEDAKDSEYGEMLEDKEFIEIMGKIKNLFNDFNGECAFSVGYNPQAGIPVSVNLASKVKSTNFLNDMAYWTNLANEAGAELKKIDDKNYNLGFMGAFNVKLGVNDNNTFYITTNSDAKAMLSAAPSKRLADFKSNITSGYGFALIDFKKITPIVQTFVGGTYANILSQLDYLEMNSDKPLDFSIKLALTDQKENSLKTIINMMKEN